MTCKGRSIGWIILNILKLIDSLCRLLYVTHKTQDKPVLNGSVYSDIFLKTF